MKRIATVIALSIALLAGGSASAQAKTYHIDPREQNGFTQPYKPTDPGVKACIAALKWAHAKPTANRDDFAVRVCTETVTTKKQAASLYKYADEHEWVGEYL